MPNARDDHQPNLPITYRPPILAVVIWFAACTVIGVAFYIVFRVVLAAPIWVQFVVGFIVVGAFLSGVLTARSFVKFSDAGITQRFLFSRQYTWESLVAWTQWGVNGSTFVRTSSGNVFGFNHWCISASRSREVCTILNRYIGTETKGDDAVLPGILKGLTNMMTSSLALDATEQSDAGERRNRAD